MMEDRLLAFVSPDRMEQASIPGREHHGGHGLCFFALKPLPSINSEVSTKLGQAHWGSRAPTVNHAELTHLFSSLLTFSS